MILEAVARRVWNGAADEEQLHHIIRLGQTLDGDLGFFLVAWGAERLAAERLAAGDFPGDAPERALLDTLDEYREFALVTQYLADRDGFRRRCRAGRDVLAGLCPDLALAA